ncbi:MAG: hypothetical protein HKN42_16340 [Granulosicoccus sp.]|nr:hypothetical protein [Granulosicoccus sp.]
MKAARFKRSFARHCVLLMAGVLPVIQGCSHVNVRQMAYEVLMQEDCRRNQLDDFCTRTFAREFLEYDRVRREFLRSQTQRAWRVNRDEIRLSENADTY